MQVPAPIAWPHVASSAHRRYRGLWPHGGDQRRPHRQPSPPTVAARYRWSTAARANGSGRRAIVSARLRGCREPAYFTPDINLIVGLIINASTIAATKVSPAIQPNSAGSGTVLYSDPALPASQLPMLVERNQIPMTNPAARAGASFDMALKPTGLSDSSPSVCRKYVPTSHHMETCKP